MAVFEILSPAWMEQYQAIIRNGAAGEDLSASQFSMYEVFKNVPVRLQHGRGPDVMFGFRIVDGRIEFPERPWEGATFALTADFEAIAPWADLPTEQTRAVGVMERLAKAGKLQFSGDFATAPAFFHRLNLHDRLAEITAPYVAAPTWGA